LTQVPEEFQEEINLFLCSIVSSVVSRDKQHASFKNENDINFEVDDTSEASGDILPGTKLFDSTWSNKLKADGPTRCH
jgi:hypothetical protein